MFHAITGKMPDGSHERHESRLLGFGKPGGDTSMAETVGYTAGIFISFLSFDHSLVAAAVELLLFQKLTRPGVIIPITSDVYDPILDRIQTVGVTWSDSITRY